VGQRNGDAIFGEVPMGESVELLVLRKGHARHLLPDGKIGVVSSHPYYEICTNPGLYELVAALIRSQQTAAVGEAGAPAQA